MHPLTCLWPALKAILFLFTQAVVIFFSVGLGAIPWIIMSEVSASFYFILSINSDNILASMGHKICYAELYDLEHGDFDLSNDFISYCLTWTVRSSVLQNSKIPFQ